MARDTIVQKTKKCDTQEIGDQQFNRILSWNRKKAGKEEKEEENRAQKVLKSVGHKAFDHTHETQA